MVSGEFEPVWNAVSVFFWGPQNGTPFLRGKSDSQGVVAFGKKSSSSRLDMSFFGWFKMLAYVFVQYIYIYILWLGFTPFLIFQRFSICFCWSDGCWWRYQICNSISGWAVWMAKWRANGATTIDGGLGTCQIAVYSRIIICAEVLSLNAYCFPLFFNPNRGPKSP